MTVVYLDAFLVLNFVVNYLLLACAGKLDGEPVGRGRTALAAALGAAYGGLALLPDWGFLEHPVCKAGAGGAYAPGGLWSVGAAAADRGAVPGALLCLRGGAAAGGHGPGGVTRGQGGCWGPLWGCGASSLRRL